MPNRFWITLFCTISAVGLVLIRPFHHLGSQSADKHLKPNDWFILQRVFPGQELNRSAVERARLQASEMRRNAPPIAENWTFAGPSNVGGRITALAVHPSAPDTVYAGAALGGVFKSTDGGLTYTCVFNDDFALSTGALAVDPQTPSKVWLGTGEANASGDSYGGNGVYLTEDGGRTWQHKGLEATRHIGKIAVDPLNPSRVFVAAAGELFAANPERGVYRTIDNGGSWERVLFLTDSTSCIDVAINPAHPDTVYAAMWERIRRPWARQVGGVTSGIWRSTDGGDTWSELITGLPHTSVVGRGGITVSPAIPSRLYAVYANHPGNLLGIYRSDNGGNSWTTVTSPGNGLYSTFGWYFGQIWADPVNQNTVYVQGVNMYRSTNAGSSWSTRFTDAHVDHHALWINPGNPSRVISGHDGGVNVSTNAGSTSITATDLAVTQFYAITSDPSLPYRLYGGTQDNSTPRTLTGATDDWDVIYGGDGFYCAVDPRNSNVIYAEYQNGGLGKSTDGGQNFFSINGAFSSDRINWMMPFTMAPQNPDILYCGTYRIWKTTNGGSSWTSISPDLTNGTGPGNLVYGTITTLDVSPANGQVIYAGTDDARVWRTLNGGISWQNISAGLPQRWVTRVTAHPDSANIVYAAFSGYKEVDYQPHLFRSTNQGTSWTDIGQGLPEAPVNDILVDPDVPAFLYAGTDFGVYYTPDLGAHWHVLGSGLPASSVFDLQITSGDPRYLVAGTHGRSMWKHPLPSAVPDAPAELVIASDGSGAQLHWNVVPGAASYSIFGTAVAGEPGALIASGITLNTWNDPDFAIRPAQFFYHVRAVR